jgi:hypothetical protein
MKRLLVLIALLAFTTASYATDEYIYGDNADYGAPYIYKIDLTTGGNVVATYSGLSGNNGRGVVTVGNTMYYTSATTNSIFAYNLSTNTDMGAVFSIPSATSLSTIAYDGTNIYVGDYSGSDHVYEYSLTGTLINTLSLAGCTGGCDGLEYFNEGGVGYLIENRGDAQDPYDVYNAATGVLVTSALISPPVQSTGIAFDGTDFYVSNIYNSSLGEYTESGTFVKTVNLTGGTFLIEDLSVDYNLVIPPPPPNGVVPEPSSFLLLGTGVLGMVGAIRRKLMV